MVNLQEIEAAQNRIVSYIHRTPLVKNHTLSQQLGTNVYLKLELLQKTGSFKPRAAFNKMLRLNEAERRRGIVAVSGGNFAQGVAYAGQTLGIPTTIFMPATTPLNYLNATRSYGATVELVPTIQAAFDQATAASHRGATFLHPFDDPDVVAGDGTIGLEMVAEVSQLTDVIVSVGGGGLATGVITAVQSLKPTVRAWTVETEGANALALALQAGQVVQMQPTSLAKTLGAPYVSADMLQVAQHRVTRHTLVTDQEAFIALRFLLERTKLLPELAAASTLAAVYQLQNQFTTEHHVVLLLCGGNVSLADLITYQQQFGL